MIALKLVSLLAALHLSFDAPAPQHAVTVRPLVQGSGCVVVYESAADMKRGGK